MYYIITCLSPEHGYLANLDYDWSEDEDPLRSWMAGERFDLLPPLPVRTTREEREDTILAELYQVPVPLMTTRLYDVLVQAGVTNIDTYPAEIHEPAKGITHKNEYVAFNIVGLRSAAALTRHDDVLISAPHVSDQAGPNGLLFRLQESVNAIFIHASVKEAIEAAGIDTLTFLEPSEWTG